MKHSELRSTCNRSVTEVPDVRNFWEDPEACDHAVFFIAEKQVSGGGGYGWKRTDTVVCCTVGLHETISTLYGGQSIDCSPTRYEIVCETNRSAG